MIHEAFKLIVFPHGENDGKFKYVIGGVLLSEKELDLPKEAILMSENLQGVLTEVLDNCKTYEGEKMGSLESAMFLLGCDEEVFKIYEKTN